MPMSHKDLWVKIKRESKGKSPAAELRILEEYLSDWPEYKGPYQELRKKLERRVAELNRVTSVLATHSGSTDPFSVRKRGLAEVALVGLPNVGKTSVFNALTGSEAEVADYPYTTLTPNIGMFCLGALEFEIVDLPPFPEGSLQDIHYAGGLKEAVVNATLVCFVLDLAGDPELQADVLRSHMTAIGALSGSQLGREGADASSPGESVEAPPLCDAGSIVVGTRVDEAGGNDAIERLRATAPGPSVFTFPFVDDRRALAEALCALTGRIIVDARDPASKDEPVAYAVPSGATVLDLATQIHKDLARRARKGRVWGTSADFDGQEVGLDHTLEAGDMVEILAR